MQVFDLEGPRMLGFEPERLSWIGVKSANHFRGAYEPHRRQRASGRVPGAGAAPLRSAGAHLQHWETCAPLRQSRPIWPLDDVAL